MPIWEGPFDSDVGAVTALQKAATSTSGLKPVKAETRDLFRRPLAPPELRDYDAVVFDSPKRAAWLKSASAFSTEPAKRYERPRAKQAKGDFGLIWIASL
jgi:hypothetical protein